VALIHDAFQSLSYWNDFMPHDQYTGVAMDTHIYQVFTDEVCSLCHAPLSRLIGTLRSSQQVSKDNQGHIQSACGNAGRLIDYNQNNLWTIVGEWTPAMTDCAKYVNGRGVGARYDGSISQGAPRYGSCDGLTGPGWTFSQDYMDFLRQTWEAQVSSCNELKP